MTMSEPKYWSVLYGILAVVALCSAPAGAQERQAWRIVEVSGQATVTRAGLTPVALTDRAELSGGEQIQTEASGRVILRRDNDTIIVAPGSLVALPARNEGLVTRIMQTFGAILVNVEKRSNPNFEIRTPFLAAIVKGTTFTVSADAVSSAVHVLEGAVRVAEAGGGASAVTVTAGQTARINSRSGEGLRVQGSKTQGAGEQGSAKSSALAAPDTKGNRQADGVRIGNMIAAGAVDASKASGGLVRNEGAGRPQSAGGSSSSAAARRGGASSHVSSGLPAGGPPAANARGYQSASIHAGGNGNNGGNANAGGGGNSGGNSSGGGNANGNGNGNAGGNGNGGGGGSGNGGNGNGNGP
jgi:hypothetical protein